MNADQIVALCFIVFGIMSFPLSVLTFKIKNAKIKK